MFIKSITVFILFFTTNLFAHNVPGMDVSLEKKENNKIHIKAFFKKSKRPLINNEVRLISKFDNRVLDKGKLGVSGLILNIPKESYWVYVLVRDNDLVKDGIAPNEGFLKSIKKEKLAFFYSSLISLVFILFSFLIAYKRTKKFKALS